MGVVSTRDYWKYRDNKLPPAYSFLSDEIQGNDRETEFHRMQKLSNGQ